MVQVVLQKGVHNLDGLASVDLLEDGQRLVVKLDQQHLQGELRCDGNNVTREDVRDAFSHLVEAKQSLHFDPNKLHIIGPGFKIRMVLMTPAAAAPPAAVSATPVPAAASKGSRNSSPTPLQGTHQYVCYLCQKSFIKMVSLTAHFRTHNGEKPFKCSFCEKAFTRKCDMKHHEHIHTGVKPYKCMFCSKSFRQAGQLATHVKTHKKLSCPDCSAEFGARADLLDHLRTTHQKTLPSPKTASREKAGAVPSAAAARTQTAVSYDALLQSAVAPMGEENSWKREASVVRHSLAQLQVSSLSSPAAVPEVSSLLGLELDLQHRPTQGISDLNLEGLWGAGAAAMLTSPPLMHQDQWEPINLQPLPSDQNFLRSPDRPEQVEVEDLESLL